MEPKYVVYGFDNSEYIFAIITDYIHSGYFYLERTPNLQGGYFCRQWGDKKFNWGSRIVYKNFQLIGISNKYNHWVLHCTNDEDNSSVRISKKNERLEFLYLQGEDTIEKRIVERNQQIIPSYEEDNEDFWTDKNQVINDIISLNSHLYSRIVDKDGFLQELNSYVDDYLRDNISDEKELKEFITNSSRLFNNYINSYNLFESETVEQIVKTIKSENPEILTLVAQKTLEEASKEILSCYAPSVVEYSRQDLLDDVLRLAIFYENQKEVEILREKYTVEYFAKLFEEVIERVMEKEAFLLKLQEYLERFFGLYAIQEDKVVEDVERFIYNYLKKEEAERKIKDFLEVYQTDRFIFNISREKELFYDSVVDYMSLSEEEKREYSLYVELKDVKEQQMYVKNSRRLKPSFKQIPDFITYFYNLIDDAKKNGILKEIEGKLGFASFENIDSFAKKYV